MVTIIIIMIIIIIIINNHKLIITIIIATIMTINQQNSTKVEKTRRHRKSIGKWFASPPFTDPLFTPHLILLFLFLFSSTISIVVILHKAGVILATAQYLFGKNHGCHRWLLRQLNAGERKKFVQWGISMERKNRESCGEMEFSYPLPLSSTPTLK